MRWLKRASPSNHLVMEDVGDLYLTGCDAELYDRPIAVLCGPSAVSNGDWFVYILRDHPMVRTFGLPTNGAFGDAVPILGFPLGWFALSSEAVLYSPPDMNNILSRQSIPVDEEVWLTREGVANGKDDVVERALEWMKYLVYVHNVTSDKPYYLSVEDTVHLSATVENPNAHQLICRAYRRTVEDVFIDSTDLIKQTVTAGRERRIANFILPPSEEFYKISLTLFDETTSEQFHMNNAISFTTAGPVKLDSILYRKGLLNYHYIRPFVHNWGKTKTIPNPAVRIICNDPWIASLGSGGAAMPNIAPNSSVGISSWVTISVIDSLYPGYFNFKVEIMSDGSTYWIDSTQMVITGVENEIPLPSAFKLEQNYPNPFNPTTTIGYVIAERSQVRLSILNILGEELKVLLNEEKEVGYHSVEFNASELPSGVYFYKLVANNFVSTKKMMLVK